MFNFSFQCVLNRETLEEVRKHIKNNDLPATKQRSSKEDVGNKSSSVQVNSAPAKVVNPPIKWTNIILKMTQTLQSIIFSCIERWSIDQER